MPWRQTRDPYAIWVSEIMCQQTQVGTVIPYYERWLQRFPSSESLAAADEQHVLAAWQGLGYYRRARNLLAGARHVLDTGMPTCRDEWLKVPGVGRYTAGAISSITLNQKCAVVDGNVERVYARLTGDGANSAQLHRSCWTWAEAQVPPNRPGDWNQALMELGATICKPVQPLCQQCPIRASCKAFEQGSQEALPTKEEKRPVVRLQHHVWVPIYRGQLGVVQIPPGEWWQGMWEFPRSAEEGELVDIVGDYCPESIGEVRHTVTHHRITIVAARVHCTSPSPNLRWHSAEHLADLPMPAPQRRILNIALKTLSLEPEA